MRAAQDELIGRDAELTAVVEFLAAVPDGPRALLFEGEAGVGKTSLWKRAVYAATTRAYRVLSAAPTEAEAGLPYAVLGDLLDPVPEEAMASLSSPLRKALDVALFRAPAEQTPTDQLAISTAFLRVLRQLASDQAVLLAVDDIQWADGPSMRVLAYAMHRLDRQQLKVIAALRVPAVNEVATALQKALGGEQLQRLEIGPLPLDVIDDLLLHRLPRPLRRPELEQVCVISAGNPFFALEIGRFILANPSDLKAGEPLPLPSSLTDAIKGRITGLPKSTRDVLVAMAALSRPDEGLLQRADRRATAALDAAFGAQVIERVGERLRFTHPLLASVVYSMADPAARREWHSRLADLVGDSEERARHLALAATGPNASVADALEEAATLANARGAPDAAAELAQQASELTPTELQDAIERRRIMTVEFRMRAGDVPGARVLLEAVLQSSRGGKRSAEALRLMGSLTLGGDDLIEAERFLTDALSEAGDDLHAQAIIERDLIRLFMQRGKLQEAFEHSVLLTEIARRSNDGSLIAVAQRSRAMPERSFGSLSPEAQATAVALAEGRLSVPIDDNAGGLHPLMDWAVVLKFTDDFARARTLFKRVLVLTEGRDESLRAPVLFHLAEMECWAGDWLLAAVYAYECEKSVIHAGHRSYARLHLNAKALLHCCRGEFEAARSAAQDALAISTSVGDEPYRRRALAILGSTELAAGDAAAANRWFDTVRARGNLGGYRGVVRSEGDEVDALIAVGRIGDAEAVSARLAGYDDPWERAIGARCRALLAAAGGDFELSIVEFERALSAHADLPMPLERARTLLGYGTVLRRTKRKRVAREKLEEALEVFKSLGAVAWIKRADSELSRIAPAAAGVGSLTPTEMRVAELVVNGRTNKEVAAALFLSVKTVEANLSRVYSKLNVRSRSQLVARFTSQR
ncbi:MAG TPA: AAA family ATPase [Candidatus Dormibacteraeota bacterium]